VDRSEWSRAVPVHSLNRHSADRRLRAARRWFLAILVFQAFYAAIFIARSSVVVEGTRYFCLFDDAMISMRYAENLAEGRGLVWNEGERVEGYTNFLWTLLLSALHRPGLAPAATCLLAQVLGALTLLGCTLATWRLARACRLPPDVCVWATAMIAAYYNLCFFTLLGMETGLLALLCTLALRDAVEAVRSRQATARPLILMGAAMLVRPDAIVVAAPLLLGLLLYTRGGRARLLLGLVVAAAMVAGHALWRHAYYGDWAPNTYYLKMTGWPLADRLRAGLTQSLFTAFSLGLATTIAAVSLVRFRRWQVPLAAAFFLCVSYQAYVGGDAWPRDRFVISAVPGLCVLAAFGIHVLLRDLGFPILPGGRNATAGAVLSVIVLLMNATRLGEWTTADPASTRRENEVNLRYALALAPLLDERSVVTVGYAGVFPYFSGARCVDVLGKCEPHIARLDAQPGNNRPGHNKHDHDYVVRQYRPDVVLHVSPTNAALRTEYEIFAIRSGQRRLGLLLRYGSPIGPKLERISEAEFGELLIDAFPEIVGPEVWRARGARRSP